MKRLPTLLRSPAAPLVALLLAVAPAARAGEGVIVAADPTAAAVGARVLQDGGNAVDAAVATAFALAVTYPQAGNLGGGGFLLARSPEGSSWVIDFRERAPAAADPRMFLDEGGNPVAGLSTRGALAAGVPGSVSGLLLALDRFGTRSRAELLEPAIRLASEGFEIPPGLAEKLAMEHDLLSADPYTASVFTRGDRPYRAGERLVQAELAKLLRKIADDGTAAFYRGDAAARLTETVRRSGGRITVADLADYRSRERAPLRGTFRGRELLTVPPPSAGGVALLQILQTLDGFDLERHGRDDPVTLHWLATAMKLAFADRARWIGDPDYVDVPVERLTSPAYAAALRGRFPAAKAIPSATLGVGPRPAHEGTETTHISVIDRNGGAVSLTTTLNGNFGAGIAVEGLGYLLNNEMDDFTTAPGHPNFYGLIEGEANAIAPGKRMVSSMCPTLVVENGSPILVLGSPGGPRIPTAVAQVILNVLVHGMDLRPAVDAPRVHHQWLPDILRVEEGAAGEATRDRLAAMGYEIQPPRIPLGSVMAAWRDPADGQVDGAADPRRYGVALVVAAADRRQP